MNIFFQIVIVVFIIWTYSGLVTFILEMIFYIIKYGSGSFWKSSFFEEYSCKKLFYRGPIVWPFAAWRFFIIRFKLI